MQFYDFLKQLVGYIPDSSGVIRAAFQAFLPYFLMACALFTAFFALKCAKWWCGLTFFLLGAGLSSKYLLPAYHWYDFQFWLLFGVSLAVGVLCAYFSKYLARAQLGASAFLTVLAALPDFTTKIGMTAANVTSAVVAAAFVYLFVKYRYLVTMATTSFTGAFILWDVLDDLYGVPLKLVWAVLTGIFALFSQTLINHEQLYNTYREVREKLRKTEHGIEHLEEKIEAHHHRTHPDEADETEIS